MTYRLPAFLIRIETDADSVARDLLRLVLTLVELVRRVMERQAIRRLDELDEAQADAPVPACCACRKPSASCVKPMVCGRRISTSISDRSGRCSLNVQRTVQVAPPDRVRLSGQGSVLDPVGVGDGVVPASVEEVFVDGLGDEVVLVGVRAE